VSSVPRATVRTLKPKKSQKPKQPKKPKNFFSNLGLTNPDLYGILL